MANLTTTLTLSANVYGGKNQTYQTNHKVASAFDTTFKVNNADGLNELIEFKPDGSKTYNKFNYLLLGNDGAQSAEIQILLREFNTTSDLSDTNPESATIDFILHPGKYFALPTSKMMVYSTDPDSSGGTDVYDGTADTSAGNKAGTSAYSVAYATTGPTFIEPPGYFVASQNHGNPVKLIASSNEFHADIEEDFFKNQMMGNTTTGHPQADHIGLFGDINAADVGTLQTISNLTASTDFANATLTLSSVTANADSATGTYIGAYSSVARLNGAHTASVTTFRFEDNTGSAGSADGQMFKKFDIIRIGDELMQITAVNNAAVNPEQYFDVKRGVLGTTAAAHEDQDAIGFHYMNNVTADIEGVKGIADMKGNSNIYTSPRGSFSANTFFGLGRDFAYPNGLVPGSVAIKFYSIATLPLGMTGIGPNTNSGLAVNTAYEYNISVDGGTATQVTFTTDATDVTFGSTYTGGGVLKKMQDALNAANLNVGVFIINGDIVFVGRTRYKGLSDIVLSAGTSGVAEMFGVGKFPALTALRPSSTPEVPIDDDIENIMFDNGMGGLFRQNGGTGIINYETGAFKLFGCPANSHMQVACNFNSALSGSIKSARNNVVPVIKARSLNAFRDAHVRVIAYDDIIDDDNVELLMTSTESDGSNIGQGSNPNVGSSSGRAY